MLTDRMIISQEELGINAEKYEDVSEIKLQEVKPGDKDYNRSMKVVGNPDDPAELVVQRARRKIEQEHWWLQKSFQEKGLPKEQISIGHHAGTTEIYNFGDPLPHKHLEELKRIFEVFSRIEVGRTILSKLKHILICSWSQINPQSGEEYFGSTVKSDLILLYPRAVNAPSYRIAGLSGFAGTLIHELGHSFGGISDEWYDRFGWRLCEPRSLPGGDMQYEEPADPKSCVTTYARCRVGEDIPESITAMFKRGTELNESENPLDSEKRNFLDEKFGFSQAIAEADQVDVHKVVDISEPKTGSQINLPHIEQPVKYRRFKPSVKIG